MAGNDRAAAGGGTVVPVAPGGQRVTSIRYSYGTTWPGPGGNWFGPSTPMNPVAPEGARGRRFDFAPGYNLTTKPRAYEPISFRELRSMADGYDLLRVVIETRKDQIAACSWNIVAKKVNGKRPKLEGAILARAQAIETFLARPDRERPWRVWLRLLLEDLLVIDAPTVYRRRTYGGDLYALQVIDGATVKLVIDGTGNTPAPPEVAYQQVLKGLPASSYTTDQLLYMPRNPRSDRVYGYSPVEQIVMTVNIALRRQLWQLQFFTEGNMPEALLGTPDSWTPEQIKEFQAWFDSNLQNNQAARRKAWFVPTDVSKGYVDLKSGDLFGEAEEWMARIICFAFSISPQQLVKMMNRATADTSKEQADEEGTEPLKLWVKDFLDRIIVEDFAAPDLEFVWDDTREVDPVKAAEIDREDAKFGLITIDEAREKKGRDAFGDAAAQPMSWTASGWVPVMPEAQVEFAKNKAEAMPKPEIVAPGATPPEKGGKTPPVPTNEPAPEGADKAARGGVAGDGGGSVEAAAGGGEDPAAPDPSPVSKNVPVGGETPLRRRAIRAIQRDLAAALADTGDDVAAQVVRMLKARDATKAAGDPGDDDRGNDDRITPAAPVWTDAEIDALIARIDLGALAIIVDAVSDDLFDVAAESATKALAGIGVRAEEQLVNRVNLRAVAWARERAAELVGKRWVDGVLIDNPNPRFAISETTRSMLRATIADGLADNIGISGIGDAIQDSYAFSPERATLVANTEVRRANSYGALIGFEEAADAGVTVKKSWLTANGGGVCSEVCGTNAAAGAIELKSAFPSGDQAPPGHPSCRCALTPVVIEGD